MKPLNYGELLAALYAGFDPDHYRWWDRVACWRGTCHRGFNFHVMGLPAGRHALQPNNRAQHRQPEAPPKP